MTAHSQLAAEAAAFKLERKTLYPQNHFVIEPHGRCWRLTIFPRAGIPRVIDGLSQGEANQRRLRLSEEGFVGKVVARGAA